MSWISKENGTVDFTVTIRANNVKNVSIIANKPFQLCEDILTDTVIPLSVSHPILNSIPISLNSFAE